MDTIRVGFIGCGAHSGSRLYPSLQAAGLELVAVCDEIKSKAEARASEYQVKNFYTDYREMCASEKLDAVLISIGPQEHYELGIDLLNSGVHVWTEKPCSKTAAQANEMAHAAEKADRIVQTGFNYRYTLGIQKAKEMIESGRFALPAMVAVRWWLGVRDRLRFMLHYVVHAVDLLNYLSPGELTGMHINYQGHDGFDYYVVTFQAEGGCIAVLEATANMAISSHWCRVDWMSKDGMLSVRDFTEVTHHGTAHWGENAETDSPPYGGDRIWRTEPLIAQGPFVDTWGYMGELDCFRQAVLGQRKPECTIREAAWGLQVCEEMMKAAASGREQ